MMTAQNFKVIAEVLRATRPAHADQRYTEWTPEQRAEVRQWLDMREAFSTALRQNNPRFDNIRFVRACEA